MPNRTTIRADTRLNHSVISISDRTPAVRANNVILMVDTGSASTLVSYEDVIRGGTWTLGAIGRLPILGPERTWIEVRGGSMSIETEQAGGGMIQNLNATNRFYGVEGGLAAVGQNAVGLLGMETMDNINVDAQKNAARTAARLARRV